MSKLHELIEFSKQNNRLCPQPQIWNVLWEKLKVKKQDGAGWKPSLPLILVAWWHTTDFEKLQRFQDHLIWAEEHNWFDPLFFGLF